MAAGGAGREAGRVKVSTVVGIGGGQVATRGEERYAPRVVAVRERNITEVILPGCCLRERFWKFHERIQLPR